MSAHIVCHSNDIMPNTFPPPRPTPQDHGLMSEYSPSLVMHDTFPPRIRTSLDPEIMPTLNKPTPTFTMNFDINDFCDPALSVTPEKKTPRSREPLNRGSDEGTALKPRNSQRVRFDNFVEVKHLSPNTSKTDVAVVRDSPDPVRDLASVTETVQDDPDPEFIMEDPLGSGQFGDSASNIVTRNSDYLEPVSVVASDLVDSRHSSGQASSQPRTVQSRDSPVEINTATAYILNNQPEHMLARPEFNSTLRVSKEIKDLEQRELDVTEAVKQKLKTSRKVKTAITEKVTAKLNTCSPQFGNLISVDVSEEHLISASERQKTAKVKPAIKTNKPEDSVVSAPDILEYLTPDLQYQTASLNLEGLPSHHTGPRTAELSRAFDVYRHIRTWQDW